MKAKLKAKWLADLRSGKYPKTKEHLRDDRGYCCLGVLCESAGIKFHHYEPETVDGVNINYGHELSKEGRELFGLSDSHHDALTRINDDSPTFAQVIDYIEHNVKEE